MVDKCSLLESIHIIQYKCNRDTKIRTLVDACVGIWLMRQKVISPSGLLDRLDNLIQAVLWRYGEVVADICEMSIVEIKVRLLIDKDRLATLVY